MTVPHPGEAAHTKGLPLTATLGALGVVLIFAVVPFGSQLFNECRLNDIGMFRNGAYTRIMVDQEKPPHPFPPKEPPDVLLLQRTIKSLEQENAWLKERLANLTTPQA